MVEILCKNVDMTNGKDRVEQNLKAEWKVFGERHIYENRWVNLDLVDVQSPDGTRFEHHVVRMQRVVGVVIPNKDGRILLVQHHRFITATWGWEIPCGIVEDSETATDAAAREVEEETGFRPFGLKPLLAYQPCIGIADTPHELFVANGAVSVGEPTDPTEVERIAWFSFDEVKELIADGHIHDSPTLLGLFTVASQAGVQLV
jgi:8-oxo-dGTP pyrophosphatase MutT (NUDIX family)